MRQLVRGGAITSSPDLLRQVNGFRVLTGAAAYIQLGIPGRVGAYSSTPEHDWMEWGRPMSWFGVMTVLAAVPLHAQWRGPASSDGLTEALEHVVARERITGMAVGVVRGDELVYARGFGVVRLGGTTPVDAHTAFNAASVATLLTAIVVMQLVEERVIGLEDPVERYLPVFRGSGISIHQLLTHTSGLTDRLGPRQVSDPQEVLLHAIAVARSRRASPPGTNWKYANANYNVLGAVVEAATGESFVARARARVLVPLGMTYSSFSLGDIDRSMLALPYRRTFFGTAAATLQKDVAWAPSTGLWTSVRDLARLASAALRRGQPGEIQILSPPTWDTMWQAATPTDRAGVTMGIGWQRTRLHGTPVLKQGGEIPGYLGELIVIPSENVALVLLANSDWTPSGEIVDQLYSWVHKRYPGPGY